MIPATGLFRRIRFGETWVILLLSFLRTLVDGAGRGRRDPREVVVRRERKCHPTVLHEALGIWEQGGRGEIGSRYVPLWSRSTDWISMGAGEGPSTEVGPSGVPYWMWFRQECGSGSQCLESQLCYVLAVGYWAGNIISRNLSFFYGKPSDNLLLIWGGPRLIE